MYKCWTVYCHLSFAWGNHQRTWKTIATFFDSLQSRGAKSLRTNWPSVHPVCTLQNFPVHSLGEADTFNTCSRSVVAWYMAKTIQLHAFHKSVYARVLSKHFTASKFKVWVASIIGHSHSNKGQKHGTAFLALCSLQKHLHSEFRLCFQTKIKGDAVDDLDKLGSDLSAKLHHSFVSRLRGTELHCSKSSVRTNLWSRKGRVKLLSCGMKAMALVSNSGRKSSQQPSSREIQDNNIVTEMGGSYSL